MRPNGVGDIVANVTVNDSNSSLFLGKTGEWWDFWLIISLVFVALAAGAVFVFTTGSINAHKREAEDSGRKVEALIADAEKAKLEVANVNKSAAEANAKALQAQLALEKLRQPRHVESTNVNNFVNAIKAFSGTKYNVAVANDNESLNFAFELIKLLDDAGWIQSDFVDAQFFVVDTRGRKRIGVVLESHVSMQFAVEQERVLYFPAKAFVDSLTYAGIEAKRQYLSSALSKEDRNILHLIVGTKF